MTLKKFSYIVVRSATTGYLQTPGDNFSYFSTIFMIYEKDIPQIFSFLAEFLSILSPQQHKKDLVTSIVNYIKLFRHPKPAGREVLSWKKFFLFSYYKISFGVKHCYSQVHFYRNHNHFHLSCFDNFVYDWF